MRGRDCDFWIFQDFSDKYGKFQNPMFWSSISRARPSKMTSWTNNVSTFYKSSQKYVSKNIKKVIDLLSIRINVIHQWKEERTGFSLQKTRSELSEHKKSYEIAKFVNIWLFLIDVNKESASSGVAKTSLSFSSQGLREHRLIWMFT